jgi:stage III sporulation protein SpoIIIAA
MSKKSRYPEGLTELKDSSGDHQIRIVRSANITYRSTEGYKNKADMRTSAINDAIELLSYYSGYVSETQKADLFKIQLEYFDQ